ncbi:MAG: hypothetical protein EZS28_032571, partial [Streblomastix strix]
MKNIKIKKKKNIKRIKMKNIKIKKKNNKKNMIMYEHG